MGIDECNGRICNQFLELLFENEIWNFIVLELEILNFWNF